MEYDLPSLEDLLACLTTQIHIQLPLTPPSSLAGTDDALGHDTPPVAICSCSACMTEPPLLQLFPVSIRRRPKL